MSKAEKWLREKFEMLAFKKLWSYHLSKKKKKKRAVTESFYIFCGELDMSLLDVEEFG